MLLSWAWGREGSRGRQPCPWELLVTQSHHSEARTMVQATPRPEKGKEAEIDYPVNQLLGTDYKINHQGKGQVFYYITQPQDLFTTWAISASCHLLPGAAALPSLHTAARGFGKRSSSQEGAGPGIDPVGPMQPHLQHWER